MVQVKLDKPCTLKLKRGREGGREKEDGCAIFREVGCIRTDWSLLTDWRRKAV